MKRILLLAITTLLLSIHAFAQGTAFTYQGRLNNNGSAANGNYDLAFTLYTTNVTGTALAGPVTNSAVAVTNGLFTTLVDFSNAFTGTSNWLEIAVSTNGANNFTTLAPRQQMTPTPYAIFAETASNVSGTISSAQLPTSPTFSGTVMAGSFSGNGVGVTNVNAAALNGLTAPNFWQTGGNTGTTNGNFLGTTDNQPLEIRVGGLRAGWISPSNGLPNLIFGAVQNSISNTTAGASILGGNNNNIGASSSYSVIGGGSQNSISSNSYQSFIGSGGGNTIQPSAYASIIGGGQQNIVSNSAIYSVLGGGYGNVIGATENDSVLVGGQQNSQLAQQSFLGGGYNNTILGGSDAAFLGGGYNNSIGYGNNETVIVGGANNSVAANAGGSFIGGGGGNKMPAGSYETIVGGNANTVTTFYGFIGGGYGNSEIGGFYSALVGGYQNIIQGGYWVFLGGGYENTNTANYGVVVGGQQNNVSGSWGSLAGGFLNNVTGNYATVPGGSNNVAAGQYSFAAGTGAQATNSGAFVWADAEGTNFYSTTGNQFSVRASGGVRFVTGGAGLTVDGLPVQTGNNGGGLTNLNASQLTSGTVPLAQLPAVVVTNNEPSVSLGSLTLTSLNFGGYPATINIGLNSLLYAGRFGDNFFAGQNAGSAASSGQDDTAIGAEALESNSNGSYNTAEGGFSLYNNTSGSYNTAQGETALTYNTAGSNNVAVGWAALYANSSGNGNIGLGSGAGDNLTTGNNNIDIGNSGVSSDNGIIRIGTPGTQTSTFIAGVINGNGGGLTNLNASQLSGGVVTNGAPLVNLGNLFVGSVNMTGNLNLPAPAKIVSGYTPLLSADLAGNSSFGLLAGAGTGGDNTAIGNFALSANTTGTNNVAAGYGALDNSTDDSGLVAIGYQALQNDNAGGLGASGISGENTAVGCQALQANTGGYDNAAIGFRTLQTNTTGFDNVAVGNYALVSNTSGSGNSAVGQGALFNNTSGSGNIAFGAGALGGNTSGSGNIGIGNFGGANLAAGNNNIDIGNAGVSSDSGVIRIGTQGVQSKTCLVGTVYASGNVGIGTNNPSQALEVNGTIQVDGGIMASGNVQAQNIIAGGATIYGQTTCGNIYSTGAVVASQVFAGGVQLTSDRNAKENFTTVDSAAVLAKVAGLPITEWKYKVDADGTEHLGPMAQDFHAAFDLNGADDKHISVVDEGGVALAAIQGLNQKLEEQKTENAELKKENQSLEKRLDELAATVQSLAEKK